MSQTQFTPEERSKYGTLFRTLDTEGLGIVTGEVSRPVFEKSGLPTPLLREIWQLADTEGNGFLTETAFQVSLRLIGHCQNGAAPSASLANVPGPLANLSAPAPAQFSATPTGGSRAPSFQQPAFPPLTPADVAKFGQLFQKTAPTGSLSGEQAKAIFLKANLPNTVLGQIWNLVDREHSGGLTQQEFTMAMYLIQNSINGSLKAIPAFIPDAIWSIAGSGAAAGAGAAAGSASPRVTSAASSIRPQATSNSLRQTFQGSIATTATGAADWIITPSQKAQYDSIFDSLDKTKTGILTPNEVAQFLMTSQLPQDVLGSIWDLADVENSGEFSKREFSIALYLVNRKLAGGDLPDIVPDSLIISAHSPVASHQQELPRSAPAPAPAAPVQQPQSSINDLAALNDLFSSPVVTPTGAPRATPATEYKAPALTSSATGSRAPFVPSSSFGQQIAAEHKPEPQQAHAQPSLLEDSAEESDDDDDEGPVSAEPTRAQRPVIPAREEKPQFTGGSVSTPPVSGAPNYEALRGFSSQPAQTAAPAPAPAAQFTGRSAVAASPALTGNQDLYTDPEVSGQLSAATTDIANLSNQINSLTTQTTQLNTKRERATNELNRILALKRDIEGKLTKLRVLYDQEVKQVAEVETVLLQSKQETDNLQKETALVEANYHATQAKLQKSQMAYEESQKQIEQLKERLGVMNAEHIELQKQHEQVLNQQKQSTSMLSVTQQQVNVLESKNVELRSTLDSTNKDVAAVEEEHENAKSRLESLKAEIPMLTAAISAAAATVAMTKSALKGTESTISYHSQQKQDLQDKHAALTQGSTEPEDQGDAVNTDSIAPAVDEASAPVDAVVEDGERSLEIPAAQSETGTETETDGITDKLQSYAMDSPGSNTQLGSKNETETPVSSPPGSEFQYAQQQYQTFNLPLARPHSTTSSVANNPPQSVRGEENVSEPGSPSLLEEDIATPTGQVSGELEPAAEYPPDVTSGAAESGVRDASQSSSIGESFEIVDAENDDAQTVERVAPSEDVPATVADASSSNVTIDPEENAVPASLEGSSELPKEQDSTPEEQPVLSAMPGGFAFEVPRSATVESTDAEELATAPTSAIPTQAEVTEFPPIRELEYEESSSSDDDGDFHDTTTAPQENAAVVQDQGDDFDDLEPAEEESAETKNVADDAFDEFAGLEEAAPDFDGEASAFDNDANDDFGQGFFDSSATQAGQAFSFETAEPATQDTNNDEWDKLFEGFGNAGGASAETAAFSGSVPQSTTQVVPVAGSHQDSQAHEWAIQELTAMGFDEASAVKALNDEDWNLENATNRLLDAA